MSGYDTSTIQWSEGRVHHDLSAFPELETVERQFGSVRAYRDRPESIDGLLRSAVSAVPEREAVVFPESNTRYTYKQLNDRVDRVASELHDNGIAVGDTVAMMLTNRPEFVELFFACQRLGAVVAPINTRLSGRELGYVLSDTDPVCVITEPKFEPVFEDVENAAVPSPIVVTDEPGWEIDSSGNPPDIDISEEATAAILYTSGTTGRPKGCLATQFALVNGGMNYHNCFDTPNGVRTLAVVPLFHVAGLTANLLHTFSARGTVVVRDGAGPETFLETIEAERIGFLLAVPTHYVLAMEQATPADYDLSSWMVGAYGGAPMPGNTISRLRDVFPGVQLCDAYGTTETVGGLVTMCPDQYTDDHTESIGLPTPPVELAVLDDRGDPLGPGELGELIIKGPIVIREYHERPEATADAFDSEGWYHTGDLAVISEDGFVSLRGRSRDKIVRGGENIYALDIEEVLTGHPDVLEASVASFPDAVLGERVLAAVVPTPNSRLTEEMVIDHCRSQLADYKVPEIIRILDELPKNPGGKVIKADLVPEPLQHGIQASRD